MAVGEEPPPPLLKLPLSQMCGAGHSMGLDFYEGVINIEASFKDPPLQVKGLKRA